MTWIDDDKAELERLHQSALELAARESAISQESYKVFQELWEEIGKATDEAHSKGLPNIIRNGSYYERKLIVPKKVKAGQHHSIPDDFQLQLGEKRTSIIFTGPKTNLILPLDICEDGVIRIKHEGECKLIQEIVRLLLRPLIFPELFKAE